MTDTLQALAALKDIEIARLKVEKFTHMYNYAAQALEMAKLELLLAQRASQTGEKQMPLNHGAAQRYFKSLVPGI